MKERLTVTLACETVRKLKALAAKRGTSISSLVGDQIEALAATDEAYEHAKNRAMTHLDNGFHLGATKSIPGAELHER